MLDRSTPDKTMGDHLSTIEKTVERNSKAIDTIKDNHLVHIGDDINGLKTGMVEVKTDLKWLKKTYWLVAGASIGSLVAAVINLTLK